jgi:hypothetical protein
MLFAVIYVASASFSAALLTAGLVLVPAVAWLLRHPLVPRGSSAATLSLRHR